MSDESMDRLQIALEAFARLRGMEEASYMTRDEIIRMAAAVADYPEDALRAALLAGWEARG